MRYEKFRNKHVLHCYDIHFINYTLCTVTLVSEFIDSLRQMKPIFLLSSVFPKSHKCTFTTFYFTFSYSSSNSLQYTLLGSSFRPTKLCAVKLYTMIFCAYCALQFLQLVNRKGKWLRIRMGKSNFIIGRS